MTMTSMTSDGHILAWPTPMLRRIYPDSAGMNERLRTEILRRRELSNGLIGSLVDGWQSEHKLLFWDGPDIQQLRAWFEEAVLALTTRTCRGDVRGKLHLAAWANVCSTGHYHTVHAHSNSMWSGVYYVSMSSPPPRQPRSGVIEFLDPRDCAGAIAYPGNVFGENIPFRPEPGMLLVFPSWLKHYVHPNAGPEERISISFNATFLDFTVSPPAEL